MQKVPFCFIKALGGHEFALDLEVIVYSLTFFVTRNWKLGFGIHTQKKKLLKLEGKWRIVCLKKTKKKRAKCRIRRCRRVLGFSFSCRLRNWLSIPPVFKLSYIRCRVDRTKKRHRFVSDLCLLYFFLDLFFNYNNTIN